ncbi:hypothetical protein RvY_09699, partial [Ramazzottius varieornatus]
LPQRSTLAVHPFSRIRLRVSKYSKFSCESSEFFRGGEWLGEPLVLGTAILSRHLF